MRLAINIIFFLIMFQSCDNNNNSNWILPPNNALTLGFSDTNDLYTRINRDSIHYGYWIDSLVFYYDNNGEKIFQNKYVIISLKLNFYPYYFLNLGDITEKSTLGIKNWYIQCPMGKLIHFLRIITQTHVVLIIAHVIHL